VLQLRRGRAARSTVGRRSRIAMRCSTASRARRGTTRRLHSKAVAWVADFWRALRPFGDGAYVNVPNAPASGVPGGIARQIGRGGY
jgi:hypothetical protein